MTQANAKRVDRASRTIAASAQAIYEAFVDPQALASWLAPNGASVAIHRFEPWAGGAFAMTLTFDDSAGFGKTSANTDVVEGRFVDLVPAERIVQQVEFESADPLFAGTMTMTWTLTTAPGGTQVGIECANVPPGIGAEDHAAGLASTLANLAAFVE